MAGVQRAGQIAAEGKEREQRTRKEQMRIIINMDSWEAGIDADAVPRVGDFVTVEGRPGRHEVVEVVYHYAIKKGSKHTVEVTVKPAKRRAKTKAAKG